MNREPQIGDIVNVTWPDFFPIKALVANEYSTNIYELIFLERGIGKHHNDVSDWWTIDYLQQNYSRVALRYLTPVSELSDEDE